MRYAVTIADVCSEGDSSILDCIILMNLDDWSFPSTMWGMRQRITTLRQMNVSV